MLARSGIALSARRKPAMKTNKLTLKKGMMTLGGVALAGALSLGATAGAVIPVTAGVVIPVTAGAAIPVTAGAAIPVTGVAVIPPGAGVVTRRL
jgi:hypothetical protein